MQPDKSGWPRLDPDWAKSPAAGSYMFAISGAMPPQTANISTPAVPFRDQSPLIPCHPRLSCLAGAEVSLN
jgi:hypothetical protein